MQPIDIDAGRKKVDMRVSTFLTVHGETIVEPVLMAPLRAEWDLVRGRCEEIRAGAAEFEALPAATPRRLRGRLPGREQPCCWRWVPGSGDPPRAARWHPT